MFFQRETHPLILFDERVECILQIMRTRPTGNTHSPSIYITFNLKPLNTYKEFTKEEFFWRRTYAIDCLPSLQCSCFLHAACFRIPKGRGKCDSVNRQPPFWPFRTIVHLEPQHHSFVFLPSLHAAFRFRTVTADRQVFLYKLATSVASELHPTNAFRPLSRRTSKLIYSLILLLLRLHVLTVPNATASYLK